MPITLITVTGVGTGGTEDAVASIDIPEDGTLESVQVAHSASLDANGEGSTAELSFIATNQIATNDQRSSIAISRLQAGILTSGGGNAANNFHAPLGIDVAGGERLYAHISASVGVNSTVNFILALNTRRQRARRSARR